MKIINGKQLGYMPDGTVFSDIHDPLIKEYGLDGDMTLHGLHIMCGHGVWSPVESGKFNGVLHMLDYVRCFDGKIGGELKVEVEGDLDDYWNTVTDTDNNDYRENDWVVVYDKEDIEKLIENLQWALRGCKD